MAQNLLAIAQNDRTSTIGVWAAMRHDILPWFAGAGLALLVFMGVSALVSGVNPNMPKSDAIAVLYSRASLLYYVLTALAVLAARRSKDIWTWIITAVLIIFFVPQGAATISSSIAPNSILQPLVAMLGILAAGRILEYVRMRLVIKLDKPKMSSWALASYGVLIVAALIMDTPIFFELLSH